MIALLLLLAAVGDPVVLRDLAHAPAPVRAFIERRQGCNHWAGEEPYDKVREREIVGAMRRLRCERVEADERKLRRVYAGRAAVVRLLEETADWF